MGGSGSGIRERCRGCKHDGEIYTIRINKNGAFCSQCREKGLHQVSPYQGKDFEEALEILEKARQQLEKNLKKARDLVEKNKVDFVTFRQYHGY